MAKREKKARNVMPRIISGVIIGRIERYSIAFPAAVRVFINGVWGRAARAARERVIPHAPRVPITAARKLVRKPRIRLLLKASNIDLSLKSSAYQCREKPAHKELTLVWLNEKTITRRIGKYITASTKIIYAR
jgi:hypothetical protein